MIWLGLAAIVSAVAYAPLDTTARPITLDQAVQLALQNSPQMIQAEGEKRVSDAGVKSAYGAFLPSVSVSAGIARRIPAGSRTIVNASGERVTLPADPWSSNVGVGANMALFEGGRRFYELRRSKARVEAAEINETTQRYSTILNVKQQYYNVLAARESEDAARAQLDQAEQQFLASSARVRARVATLSDSLRGEIQRSNARLALLESRTSLAQANAALTRAVGAPETVTAAPAVTTELLALPLDEAGLRALAENGPDVRAAQADLGIARQQRRIAWTDYFPGLNLGYSYGGSGTSPEFGFHTDKDSYSGSVRLSLSFPLFNQFQREAGVVSAQVSERNAEAALRDARLAALESLAQSLGSYNLAVERVLTQMATVQAAEEDLRVQRQRYGVGNSTLLDVLTSQTQLNQARLDLIRARYDQRVARAQLEALVGRDL